MTTYYAKKGNKTKTKKKKKEKKPQEKTKTYKQCKTVKNTTEKMIVSN